MNLLLNPPPQTSIQTERSALIPQRVAPLALKKRRVLILSSLTGWGHKRVAEALRDALKTHEDPSCEFVVHIENVLEQSNVVNQALAGLYNWFLRYAQPWMFLYYHFINFVQLSHQPLFLEPMTAYAQRLYDEHQPDLLISVHPMMQYFGGILQRIHAKHATRPLSLFAVVSDPCYGFWKDWVRSNVTHYFTATRGASQQLYEYGVNASKISELGLPQFPHAKTWTLSQKHAIRRAVWGERASCLSVFFNAGWAGGGTIERLFKAFLVTPEARQINLIFQAGTNEPLQKRMKALVNQHPHVSLLLVSSEEDMRVLYALADVIVTKPGAATVFESLHHGVPLWIDQQERLMPQEKGTAEWLFAQGAGAYLTNIDALIETVQNWLKSPRERQAMSREAQRLSRQSSSEALCKRLLKGLWSL
jgi:UDP-N-acetylglucosamine:LPS N-acetylglucosamine transferase